MSRCGPSSLADLDRRLGIERLAFGLAAARAFLRGSPSRSSGRLFLPRSPLRPAWRSRLSSHTAIPRSRISARVSGLTNAPPPVAITPRRFLHQPRDHAALAVAEIRLAEALEDLRHAHRGGILDRFVGIDEVGLEHRGELAADGRLADSHQPDQHHRPVEPARRARRSRFAVAGAQGSGSSALPLRL